MLPIIILLSALFSIPANAVNLGVNGELYPIKEMDLLQFIQQRLLSFQQNGELQKMQTAFLAQAKTHIDRPSPLSQLSPAEKNRQWKIDPSIVLSHNLYDQQGRLFA